MRLGAVVIPMLAAATQCRGLDRRVEGATSLGETIKSHSERDRSSYCPRFAGGTFDLHAYQLYPENADWDDYLCQVYFGILFNASFGIYDPYIGKLEVIEIAGYSHNPEYHLGGVQWDKYTGLVTMLIGPGASFNTAGADISGTNLIKKFNPYTRRFLWSLNLTDTSKGRYGGFNDIATDIFGNTYVVSTFPGTILRIDRRGLRVAQWYLPPSLDHTVRGYAGIASVGTTILAMNSSSGQLYRFDARMDKGTPALVPRTPNLAISGSDAIHLPVKYGGSVMLVAEHQRGVTVLRSWDRSWTRCEHLGTIPNPANITAGALVVSTTQIGSRLYALNDWFGDPVVSDSTAGNRTSFPMVDITAQVSALLA